MSKTLLACILVVAGCGGMAQNSGESSASSAVSCPASVPAWSTNTYYAAGTFVSYGGTVYQCLQSHTSESDWTPPAVASLWTQVSCASGGTTSGGGGTTSSGGGGGCGAPAWVAGAWYDVGDIVTYSNGSEYIATHANPGYDPTISTWFWSTHACSGGGTTSGGGGTTSGGSSCGATPWVQGANYVDGNIVSYQGADYICTNPNPGYSPTISTWFWSPYTCTSGGGGTTGGGGGGTGGSGLAAILSESEFDAMFPNRNAFYTYQGLVSATASYAAFATSGSSDVQKREVAALLANVAHETAGLVYIDEIVQGVYCDTSSSYPCAAGQEYFGRGPLQISWNFNYGAAGAALGLPLLANPNLVSTNATVAWQTALWFWMTSTGAGGSTCHNAIVNGAGFGATIQTINGSIECNGGNPGEVSDRVQFYLNFCAKLGVDPGANISC